MIIAQFFLHFHRELGQEVLIMTRKRIAAFAVSLLICTTMAGCADTNSKTSANQDTASASAAGTVSETEAESQNTEANNKIENEENVQNNKDLLVIAKQGMFSSGETVTHPVEGNYAPTQSRLDATRAGSTSHIDHANIFYQIPENDNGTVSAKKNEYYKNSLSNCTIMPFERLFYWSE